MLNPIHAIKAGARLIDFNHAAMRVANAPLDFLIGPFLGGNVANSLINGEIIGGQTFGGKQPKQANLHARKSAHINQRARVLQHVFERVKLALQILMHVLALAAVNAALAADDRVIFEIVVRLGEVLNFLVVQKIGAVRCAHEQFNAAAAARP